jgi:membrane-associated phospholipid phosphatase
VGIVTRLAIIALLVVLVLLLALPLGLGMAMHDCPACHPVGSGLLDGCLAAVVSLSVALIGTGWSRSLPSGVRDASGSSLILGVDRPPRSLSE